MNGRRITWPRAAALAALLAAAAAQGQETTAEQLQELQELRAEVGRRRAELQRELRLLKQVLGEEVEEVMAGRQLPAEGPSMDEVAAELRRLREDLQGVREQLLQELRPAPPEERFVVAGQVRIRGEWNDADFVTGTADLVQLMRSRVRVVGWPDGRARVVVELQDARRWGEESSPADAAGDAIDFHQAYVELERFHHPALGIRVGRQELQYGSGRLLASPDWANPGLAYNAVRLTFGGASRAEVLYGKLAEKGARDRNLYGLAGHLEHRHGRAEPFLLVEHDKGAGADRLLRGSLGLRAEAQHSTAAGHLFGGVVEGVAQVGEVGEQDVLAFLASASARYRGPSSARPGVELGLDWLSGDAAPADGKRRAFEAPYGNRHAFLGHMDLFGSPADTGERGLADFYLKGETSAAEQVRLALHVHHFALVEGTGRNLGQEADVVLTYQYSPTCEISWGGMVFVPADAMKAMRGEDPAFKTYLQTAARF